MAEELAASLIRKIAPLWPRHTCMRCHGTSLAETPATDNEGTRRSNEPYDKTVDACAGRGIDSAARQRHGADAAAAANNTAAFRAASGNATAAGNATAGDAAADGTTARRTARGTFRSGPPRKGKGRAERGAGHRHHRCG